MLSGFREVDGGFSILKNVIFDGGFSILKNVIFEQI